MPAPTAAAEYSSPSGNQLLSTKEETGITDGPYKAHTVVSFGASP
jgi:hypothetical protein